MQPIQYAMNAVRPRPVPITPPPEKISGVVGVLSKCGDSHERLAYFAAALSASIQWLAIEADRHRIKRTIEDAMAYIAAEQQIAAEEKAGADRFTYDRDDSANPNTIDPQGIEGFAVGRWAR